MKKNFLRFLCAVGLVFAASGNVMAEGIDDLQKDGEGFYLLGNLNDWKVFAQAVNEGAQDLNARFTADIEGVTENECLTTYKGHLDGQCHKLTVNINRVADDAAPIYVLQEGGIVENLWTDGVITSSNKYACGICSEQYSSTIRNCVTTITFNCTGSGDATHGGFAGKVWTGSIYENLVFAGTYNAPEMYSVSGINGYNRSSVSTFLNCLSLADKINAQQNNSNIICREKVAGAFQNCYYIQNDNMLMSDNAKSGSTAITREQVQSGEVCFMLNGDQKEIRFYQNLGEDEFPVPFNTHKRVYTTAQMRCDGKVLGEGSYTNDASAQNRPDHKYVDGFCTECGEAQEGYMQPEADGYYNIASASQYKWMVDFINKSENKAINLRLTADVETEDNSAMFKEYSGTFDGQGHTLTLHISANQDAAGMFVTLYGTLKNINLDGGIHNEQRYAGAVAGYLRGRVENVVSRVKITTSYSGDSTTGTIGGIAYSGCYLKGVLAAGTLETSTAHSNGGVIGWASEGITMENVAFIGSLVSGDTNSTTMSRNSGNCTFINCYYLNAYYNNEEGSRITKISAEEIGNGSLCYKLNGNSFLNASFFQTIGTDAEPVLDKTHGLVYAYGEEYGDIHDDASFNTFRTNFINAEEAAYSEEIIAEKALVESYLSQLNEMKSINSLNDFLTAFAQANQTKNNITASVAAYVLYQMKVDEIKALLDQDPTAVNPLRDILRDYVEGEVEPNEDLLNGSALYITTNHELSAAQLNAEIEWMDAKWKQIVNSEYEPNTDITSLLINADFSNGVNGWDGNPKASPWGYNPNVVESWRFNSHTFQSLKYLKNGVYEVICNGMVRPGGKDNSHLYFSYLYANDQQVPLQYAQEDLLAPENAVDRENCLLGNDGELNGSYYPASGEGMSYAVKGNRYVNRILVNVTDGNLTLGVRADGTGIDYDWTIFGNMKLFYRGDLSQSDESLTNVLNGQVARANTILNYDVEINEDFAHFPGFSAELRQQLQDGIAAAEAATTPEAKYEQINKFSALFPKILVCQKAYTALARANESVNDFVQNYMAPYLSADQKSEAEKTYNGIWDIFTSGSATTEEALNLSPLKAVSFYDKIAGIEPALQNGYYQITNAKELLWFSLYVNNTNNYGKAVLTTDIDMSELLGWMPIGNNAGTNDFKGIFDGQGHSIKNFKMEFSTPNSGLFGSLRNGATVKNFSIYGDMTCKNGAENCGVFGNVNSSYVKFVHSYLNITCESGAVNVGGIVGWGAADNRDCPFSYMDDCSYSGTLTLNGCSSYFGGLCGFTDWMQFQNCANYGNIIINGDGGSHVGGIVAVTDQSTFPGMKHCLNVGTISGTASYVGALVGEIIQYNLAEASWNFWMDGSAPCADSNKETATFMNTFKVSADELANGYVCERLNKNLAENHWYQVAGDAYPRLYNSESEMGSQDQRGEVLITSASQLSSNASDSVEGQNIENLIDKNPESFWHTDWHGQCQDANHYLQVALNSVFTGQITMEMTRRKSGDDHPTGITVYGSTDGENFTEITQLTLPFEGQGTVVSALFNVSGVKYLRFTVTNCGGNNYGFRTFWHAAEFQLYGNNENAIEDIKTESPVVKGIYNLNGQRVNKAVKGLYIIDGKKVMVK